MVYGAHHRTGQLGEIAPLRPSTVALIGHQTCGFTSRILGCPDVGRTNSDNNNKLAHIGAKIISLLLLLLNKLMPAQLKGLFYISESPIGTHCTAASDKLSTVVLI